MARRQSEENYEPLPPPATTLEGREDQLIAAAMDLVERRIRDSTASAQETVHFLKLGSVRNQLEQEELRGKAKVLQARIDDLESRRTGEDMYANALAAFKGYSGQVPVDPEADEEEFYDPDLQ